MFLDRVVAEEHLGVVDQVQLEQRHGRIDPHLRPCVFDQAQVAELINRIDDRFRVPSHDPACTRTESGTVGQIVDSGWQRPRDVRVRHQKADGQRRGPQPTRTDLVERFSDRAVQRLT